MLCLNIKLSDLRAPAFKLASRDERGTWFALLVYAVDQDNGDMIKGCRGWTDQQWQSVCQVGAKEVASNSTLWKWDGPNLVLWGYPKKQDRKKLAKLQCGKGGVK